MTSGGLQAAWKRTITAIDSGKRAAALGVDSAPIV